MCDNMNMKSLFIWLTGKCYLILLFHFSLPTIEVQKWKSRFKSLSISPTSYTWQFFHQAICAVYVKLSLAGPKRESANYFHPCENNFYIGSTQVGIPSRESSRNRKQKQLEQGQLVQVEPALRWWLHKGNYQQFATILIATCEDAIHARIQESLYINKWQPALNYPYIMKIKFMSTGIKQVAIPKKAGSHIMGARLFAKIRRKDAKTNCVNLPMIPQDMTSHEKAWTILNHMASSTEKSYTACKLARSIRISPMQLYALFKMALNMEEPARTKVRSLIKKAIKFRTMSVPKYNKPLAIPFLCHTSFKKDVQGWLKQQVTSVKHLITLLHIPTTCIIEAKHQSIKKLLFNQNKWMKEFEKLGNMESTCNCEEILKANPLLETVDDHIASPAALLNVPPHVQDMLAHSANNMIFPSKSRYLDATEKALNIWIAHHQLPPTLASEWKIFIEDQWKHHLERSDGYYKWKDLQLIKSLVKNMVVHCKDHAPAQVMIYCPVMYRAAINATFEDKEVYQRMPSSPMVYKNSLKDMVPKDLAKTYKWGLQWESPLPYGYVFLKKKKLFKTARSIISYRDTCMAKLLKATAQALLEVAQIAYPSTFGNLNNSQVWPALHHYLENLDIDISVEICNDDLVGFFTSLPQDRITQAVQHCLYTYYKLHPTTQDPEEACFSVKSLQNQTVGRVFRGQIRKAASTNRVIYVKDILEIVKTSFSINFFQVMGVCYRQIRGSSIGNQISPVLCAIAVAFEEHIWTNMFHTFLQSHQMHLFLMRYVDNRFFIYPKELKSHPAMTMICDEMFYKDPVILEPVGDLHILGFLVDPEARTVTYIIPPENWQHRTAKSAGTQSLNLGGYRSRAVIIKRQTFPKHLAHQYIVQLKEEYKKRGYSSALLEKNKNKFEQQLFAQNITQTFIIKPSSLFKNMQTLIDYSNHDEHHHLLHIRTLCELKSMLHYDSQIIYPDQHHRVHSLSISTCLGRGNRSIDERTDS